MYIFFSIFFIIVLLCFFFNYWRRSCIIKKVRCMCNHEKCELLNEMIDPLGYKYIADQDVFITNVDAWQKEFGYTRSYDYFAPFFNMVFDSERIFFDYDNRSWLIELWKGQYGINTGGEIGVYCADGIVPHHKRNIELFHAVSEEEMPHLHLSLKRKCGRKNERIANVSMRHWWLAVFRMGCFSKPCWLTENFCINFSDCGMLRAFADALVELGYDESSMHICGSYICFSFKKPKKPFKYCIISKLVRAIAQCENRLFCKLFIFITRPFKCTVDRLVYLYYYLPPIFRHCLKRYKKRLCRGKRI